MLAKGEKKRKGMSVAVVLVVIAFPAFLSFPSHLLSPLQHTCTPCFVLSSSNRTSTHRCPDATLGSAGPGPQYPINIQSTNLQWWDNKVIRQAHWKWNVPSSSSFSYCCFQFFSPLFSLSFLDSPLQPFPFPLSSLLSSSPSLIPYWSCSAPAAIGVRSAFAEFVVHIQPVCCTSEWASKSAKIESGVRESEVKERGSEEEALDKGKRRKED